MSGFGDLSAKHATEENLLKRIEALESLVGDLQRRKAPVRNLEDLSNDAGLLEAGEFRTGNGIEPGSGFTGLRMGFPGFVYGSDTWHIVGVNDDDLQVGISATDGAFYAAGGAVIFDSLGIRIKNNAATYMQFEDDAGDYTNRIYSGSIDGRFNFSSLREGPGNGFRWWLRVSEADGAGGPQSIASNLNEPTAGLVEFSVAAGGDIGARIRMGNTHWRAEESGSADGGWNYFQMEESTAAPPEDLSADNEGRWYFRGNKFVIQWNDGGTYQYHTLDLQSGAPSFFTRSTSAPSDTIAGLLGMGAATTLTISSGVVSVTRPFHTVAAQSGTSDNLDTINGGVEGDIIVLQRDTGDTITVRHNQDNIRLNGGSNRTLGGTRDKLTLIKGTSSVWHEISFST